MSVLRAAAFIEKVKYDPSLKDRIKGIIDEYGEDAVAEVLRLARELGYEFSPDDYRTAIREQLRRQHRELSEEELEGVAGGRTAVISNVINFLMPL